MLRKTTILMYLMIVTVISLSGSSWAQNPQVKIETLKSEDQKPPANDFENLVSPEHIVYQLQKNYGLKGSIILTEALVQILNSYSNQQQAQTIWQAAINKVTELRHRSSQPRLNARFNLGHILSLYTHGMDIESWNDNRSGFKLNPNNLSEVFDAHDDVSLYFNLNKIWHQLLKDLSKKENIQWNDVFFNSLDLFAQDETPQQINKKHLKENKSVQVFREINEWQQTGSESQLAQIAVLMRVLDQDTAYLYQRMIALSLEKNAQNYISAALAWFAVAQQLYVNKGDFTENQRQVYNLFIEANDAWFLANESALRSVHTGLPEAVEKSFHDLKMIFNSVDESDDIHSDFSSSVKSAYQLQGRVFKKYMATPFRNKIRTQLEVCLNISEESDPLPQQPIDSKQFNGCINDMVNAATTEAVSRELSGSLTKINSDKALVRALQLPPWQSINILYAHMANDRCLDEVKPLVNPLEWALAAESLLWFADRWPAYMKIYHHTDSIKKIVDQGHRLTTALPCLESDSTMILNGKFKQIEQSWQNVRTQIQNVVTEFKQNQLTQGSDINLLKSPGLDSYFGIEDYKIKACDAQNSCGVHVELASSKTLFGLFPNHLLEAHQLQLGQLKLCYDAVGWENRRSTATHLDNDSVANYFGNFSFSLKGFYNDALVFERKLTDTQEYLYLFAENSDDVLNTACPLPIVGSKISTQLKRGTYGLVPNRLTFLTASRANESDILINNWSKGEEWKDKILSPDVQVLADNGLNALNNDIQKAYRQKAAELQDIIYQALLNTLSEPTEPQQQLTEAFAKMQLNIKMFYAMNYVLKMDDVLIGDKLHGIFFGDDKLPNYVTIAEYFRNQVNINLFLSNIADNLKLNQQKWNSLEPSMSYSHIKNIIYQLKLYE